MTSTAGAAIAIRDLTYVDEDTTVLVGCRETDSYARFPPDGAALLRYLQSGASPASAARWYQAEYHEPIDITDFVETVTQLGFTADGGAAQGGGATSLRGARLGRALFGPTAWVAYAVLLISGLVVFAATPAARPTARDLFFVPSLTVSYLVLAAVQIPLCLLHECFHALAARRIGVATRTTVSRRFLFVVFETRMDGLVTAPRRQRFLPILAGVLLDGIVASVACMAATFDAHHGAVGPVGRLALAIALTTFLRIAWQFYFFLANDGYYLIATVLGTDDLHGAAMWRLRAFRRGLWHRGRPKPTAPPDSAWSDSDLRHARWYAPLIVTGYLLLLSNLVMTGVPAVHNLLHVLAGRMFGAARPSGAELADTIGFFTINLIPLGLPAVIAMRERAARRRQ